MGEPLRGHASAVQELSHGRTGSADQKNVARGRNFCHGLASEQDLEHVDLTGAVAGDDESAVRGDGAAWNGASPVKAASSRPVARSQSRSVRSSEPETARRPSGVTATALTQAPWPSRVASSAPCSRSQTLSVRSYEPETARRPSGVTATALTPSPWPSRVASSAPCSRSQTLSVPIVRGRDRAPPVRRHRHRRDPAAMALQGRTAVRPAPGPRP